MPMFDAATALDNKDKIRGTRGAWASVAIWQEGKGRTKVAEGERNQDMFNSTAAGISEANDANAHPWVDRVPKCNDVI